PPLRHSLPGLYHLYGKERRRQRKPRRPPLGIHLRDRLYHRLASRRREHFYQPYAAPEILTGKRSYFQHLLRPFRYPETVVYPHAYHPDDLFVHLKYPHLLLLGKR